MARVLDPEVHPILRRGNLGGSRDRVRVDSERLVAQEFGGH
uniref:Uncharacterized protein n=1 Tax=Arundo donax TaxID=35708 RepID=A0A0A9BLF1_ARUDO